MNEKIGGLSDGVYDWIAEKDAEIERLKAIIENQKEAINRWAEAGSSYEQLIGELADALFRQRGSVFEDELIQRARKAIQ